MARKKSFRPAIKPAETIDELRRGVETELNRLSTQLGSQDFFGDASANTYRLTRLGNPAAEHDAVNLKTMRKAIDEAIRELYGKLHRPDLSRSYNYNDEEFSIIPGGFVINGLDMSKSFNFDTDIFGNDVDFTVLAGGIGTDEIAAGAVTTLKLTTQEINLGYGGNDMPVRLRIYDTSNNPIGWIGDDSINHGGDTDYVGAWFKRLLVGGDGTLGNAGMFADANGNVVAKSIWVYDALGTTGWIGSRQTSGPDPQTYYGGFFKELYVGGSWSEVDDYGPLDAPLYVDNAGNLRIQDGTIELADSSGNTIEISTDNPLLYTGNSGEFIGFGEVGSSTFINIGAAVGAGTASTATMYWDNWRQTYGTSPVVENYMQIVNGYGELYLGAAVTGLPSIYLDGGEHHISITDGGTSNTPDLAGGGALASASGQPWWYDQTANVWKQLAYTGGGASPGGADHDVQFNNSGAFGGENRFTWNDTTDTLTIYNGTYYVYITGAGIQTTGNAANAIEATAGGVTAEYLIADGSSTAALLLNELSSDHTGTSTSHGYIYHKSDALYFRYHNGVSWTNDVLPILDNGSSNTEVVYNSGGNGLDSASTFYFSGGIVYGDAFEAASLFRLGTYAGVNGTFVDNGGNTVRVRGGIITDLTE
jgi:hypothetical protein